jgi:hypothetical protein
MNTYTGGQKDASVSSRMAADWSRQASMNTCAGGQKDAAAGSTAGQKDVAV